MHRPARRPSLLRACVIASAAVALLAPVAGATPTYSLSILGTLRTDGTGTSYAGGINDAGVVVGGASNESGVVVFRWRQATGMSDRGALVVPYATYGLSINSSEALCGFGLTQSNGFAAPLRENPAGPIVPLTRFAGGGDAYAYRIAENGTSVGWSNSGQGCGSPLCAGNPGHAVTWDSAGVMTALPELGGYYSAGTDISADGSKICGYAANPLAEMRAFRLVSGVATELPPLAGYSESQAWGINDAGQVVGASVLGNSQRATLWNATTPIDLGAPEGALGSVAVQIGETGAIAGYSIVTGPSYRALTFAAGSAPTDLNSALEAASPWTLLYCNDLNASGQMVGVADSAGTQRGFVLTPAGTTAVDPAHGGMRGLDLRAPLPNPSRAATALRFSLAEAGRVRLDVVDLGGRVVARLGEGWRSAGEHVLEWNGRDEHGDPVRPGVFFVRLASAGRVASQKLVISR